jgi:hypothetical protein
MACRGLRIACTKTAPQRRSSIGSSTSSLKQVPAAVTRRQGNATAVSERGVSGGTARFGEHHRLRGRARKRRGATAAGARGRFTWSKTRRSMRVSSKPARARTSCVGPPELQWSLAVRQDGRRRGDREERAGGARPGGPRRTSAERRRGGSGGAKKTATESGVRVAGRACSTTPATPVRGTMLMPRRLPAGLGDSTIASRARAAKVRRRGIECPGEGIPAVGRVAALERRRPSPPR